MLAARDDDDETCELDQPTVTHSQATTEPSGRPRPRRASAPPEPGERYQLGRRIAKGGMGEIVEAFDTQIGRDVAIKRLLRSDPTQMQLARFLREARIQGRLDHPAIVPVHELDHDEAGLPFFVMKKLSGTTLAAVLKSDREGWPLQRLLHAFVDVCLAIEFAHTRGVLHRDLKPANILLGDFGEVYVLDWGIARMIGDGEPKPGQLETAVGITVGTPGYMSPEQIRGQRDLDARSDVYALGCLLYKILADDLPPELDTLCVLATATDCDDRLGSARELAEGIQRYLDGDRDLAQRSRLASEHLAVANDAIASGDDEHHRRLAMREAGRALALDPTLSGAAELVGKLMIESPLATPEPVRTELAALDEQSSHYHAKIGVAVHAGYLAFAALYAILGVRDIYIALLAILSAFNIATAWIGIHKRYQPLLAFVILGNIATIALFARIFSPFLVAPGLGAVTVMAFAFHPIAAETRTLATVAVGGILSVIGMWILEAVGVLAPSTIIEGSTIHMTSPVAGIEALPVIPSLCFYTVTLLAIATALAHNNARFARGARERLHIQAWQLRQLLPLRER